MVLGIAGRGVTGYSVCSGDGGARGVPSREHVGSGSSTWCVLEEEAGAKSLGRCSWWPLIRGFAHLPVAMV